MRNIKQERQDKERDISKNKLCNSIPGSRMFSKQFLGSHFHTSPKPVSNFLIRVFFTEKPEQH
jgi:hypothetical protein